ncbi:hypothetical protein QJS66_08015 [Kocuria rhizophila]|nr:hypothetical protein QJS66_08015 [Kocuria rhizophila]
MSLGSSPRGGRAAQSRRRWPPPPHEHQGVSAREHPSERHDRGEPRRDHRPCRRQGIRMKSKKPKILHEIGGIPCSHTRSR